MTAAIEILSGELLGRSYAVDEMPFAIGRKDDCAIVIPKKYFSRRHAEIVRKGTGFAIRGLSAKNPVILNDEEVEEHGLADKDEFEICGVRFRFHAEGHGASRAEREREKHSDVVQAGSRAQQSKTSTARRGRGRPDPADDLEDGPLDDDEATEQKPRGRRGADDLEDGDLPQSGDLPGDGDLPEDGDLPASDVGSSSKGRSRDARASARGDLDDGPLPGEAGGGERFQFGGDDGSSGGGAPARSGARGPSKSAASKADARGSRAAAAGSSQAKRGGSEPDAKDSLRVDGAPGWKAGAADGPRGGERVVFGDDAPPAAAKKSKASGSGDENERTDQLDISKLKTDDPFAPDTKKAAGKDPASIAAREKFLKALVAIGVAGILLAGGIIYKIGQPPEKKYFDYELGTCGVNETKLFNPPLNEDDPPEVERVTPLTGAPTSIIEVKDAAVARIEWAVPSTQHVALFLVTGISEGSTSFQLTSKGNVTTIYHVKIAGLGPHDLARKKRQDALAALSEDDLRKKIEKFLSEGDQLQKEIDRAPNLTDRYARQIFASYERAEEAFNALAKLIDQSGVSDPALKDKGERVRKALEGARDFWEKERDHVRTSYVDYVNRGEYQAARDELRKLLNMIGDHCGADYQRFNLLLEKKFRFTTFKDVGCVEEEPR